MNLAFRCLESRIDKNNTLYGKFQIGSIPSGQGSTFANTLRRGLLSDLSGLAITHFAVTSNPNVTYEFSTLPGLKESILDFSLNLKQAILTGCGQRSPSPVSHSQLMHENCVNYSRKTIQINEFPVYPLSGKRDVKKRILFLNTTQIGFLKAKGPCALRAADLILPPGIRCVHPDHYLGTLSADGALSILFLIAAGKGYMVQPENLYQSLSRSKLLFSGKKNNKGVTIGSDSFTKPANDAERSPFLGQNALLNRFEWKKHKHFQKSENKRYLWGLETKRNSLYPVLPLDATFSPISRVNYQITLDNETETKKEVVTFEIWTNGSITPKRAIQEGSLALAHNFYNLFCSINESVKVQFYLSLRQNRSLFGSTSPLTGLIT